MLADGLVVRDVAVVELGAVVVADQPGHLLEVLGLELDDGRRAVAMRLLPPRDERLAEQAADRLAAEEAQMAGRAREAEELLRPRRAQPLEVDGQLRTIEVSRRRRGGTDAGQRRRGDVHAGCPAPSMVRSQPSAPHVIGWIAVSRPSVQRPRLGSGRPQR